MGTWDDGLLDNDTALDGLGELSDGVVADIVALGALPPGPQVTPRLAAAVGLLLQLSQWSFSSESDDAPKIAGAVRAHAAALGDLSAGAGAVLRSIADGRGAELAERPGQMAGEWNRLLHVQSAHPAFGLRDTALFAGEAAAAYVQEVANRCVETINSDFAAEENWNDLCREAPGMGALAALLVLEPCRVSLSDIQRWRSAAAAGLHQLEEEEDDELEFHRGYYRNLDTVFSILEQRFA